MKNLQTYTRQARAVAASAHHIATPRAIAIDNHALSGGGWLAVGERTIDDSGRQHQWYYGPRGVRYEQADVLI